MKALIALAALAVFNIASAQKTIELKDFKSVSVGADTKVTLVKSTQNKLVVKGDEYTDLDIENEGGTLSINGEGLDLTLYYKNDLESIAAASDAQVFGKDEINSKELSLAAASDAKIELRVNVKKLHTAAASDAKVTLTGKATDHDATISSDADLKGQDLLTENTSIVLSSDGSASITVKGTVNATVSSDGSLKVYGNPKKVNEVTAADGEISIIR